MKKSIIIILISFITASIASQNTYNVHLSKSLSENNLKDAEYWIKKGADVNYIDSTGLSALHIAARDGNIEIVKFLINNGANVDILDAGNRTPLMYAAYNGYLRICQALYQSGSNIKKRDKFNKRVEFYAKSNGYKRVAKFLTNPTSNTSNLTSDEYLNIGTEYLKNKKLDSCLIYWEKTIDKYKEDYDSKKYKHYYKNLNAILSYTASLHMAMNHTDRAKVLFEENLYEAKRNKNALNYLTALGNLGTVYLTKNKNVIAEKFINRAYEFGKKNKLDSTLEFSSIENNIGILFLKKGNTVEAEKYFINSFALSKNMKNQDDPLVLMNLGYLKYLRNDFENAESYYLKSIEIYEHQNTTYNIGYLSALDNLALLYQKLGIFDKAKYLAEKALIQRKLLLGNKSPDYLFSLNNLALIYFENGLYENAKNMFIEAIETALTVKNIDYSFIPTVKCNLASTFSELGDYIAANTLFREALKSFENNKQENNIANTLNQLGNLYSKIKQYNEAYKCFQKSFEIRKRLFGNESLTTIISQSNIAHNQLISKQVDSIQVKFENVRNDWMKYIENQIAFLSTNEKAVFWENNNWMFIQTFPSYSYKLYTTLSSTAGFAFDSELFSKSFLLNTSIQIQNTILQSGDTSLINSWEELKSLKRQIDKLQQKTIAERQGLSELETKADKLDKELTKRSQLYKQSKDEMKFTWQDVQKSLQPNEAAIEFVNFRYFNRELTDSMLNYALVLKKDSKYPELIPLFEDKQLDSLFVKSATDVNQLYTYRVTNLRKDTAERTLNYGSKLYNLVWKPLEASLNGIKTVYFAPSGKLNQVAFAAIPVDSTTLLSDKYNLHQVTSTRQVIKNQNAASKLQEAALFGGIQYELDNKQLAQVQTASPITNTTYSRSVFVADSTQRSNSFTYLKGTYDEVNGIANEFKQKGLSDQLYTGAIASEAAFKKLNGTNTDIIHIATHGFYLPVEETKREDFRLMGFEGERRNVVVNNPLLRSGLVMAGANRAWRGDSIPENWEDGILTAHEISQINLTNTELVVLSACETGLGDNGGSEGVFGLQRAFKMAGVQTLIMSLWKVPDTQTSQLMQGFYKYWLGGMTKHDAFKKAQNEVRAKNPNPYYWAAFVMVD